MKKIVVVTCGIGAGCGISFHPECWGSRPDDGRGFLVATIYLELGSILPLE
jgi:hypothetical protein